MNTAIITGASRGLGRELALTLLSEGWRVVGIARASADLDALANQAGAQFTALVADVSDPDAMVRAATEAHAVLGHIDLLVHNASTLGPVPLRPALEVNADDMARVFAVNVAGPHALTQRIAGAMALREHGTVLAISSDAATNAYPDWGPYGAAKAANDHLFRVLAAENPALRFVTLDPGEMNTAMHAAALPDADPNTLTSPRTVAQAIVRQLPTLPSGARVQVMP